MGLLGKAFVLVVLTMVVFSTFTAYVIVKALPGMIETAGNEITGMVSDTVDAVVSVPDQVIQDMASSSPADNSETQFDFTAIQEWVDTMLQDINPWQE